MEQKAKKTVKYILSLLLAAVFIWLAFRKVDWAAFFAGLKETRWIWIPAFFAASTGALIFRALRWKMLLRPLDGGTRVLTVWDANNVGNLANVVLPGSGEFVRCGYVSRKAGYDAVLGTAVVERACDLAAIALLFILALILDGARFGAFFKDSILTPASGRLALWWVGALAVIFIAGMVLAIFRFRRRSAICDKAAAFLEGLWKGIGSISRMDHKCGFILYTICIWLMYVLMSWCIIKAIPALDGLGLADALFISAVGNIASVIPVPGGIGAYHYLVALTLSSLYGSSWDIGILFATLNHELHLLLVIVLGAISYFCLTLRKE